MEVMLTGMIRRETTALLYLVLLLTVEFVRVNISVP